MVCVQEYSLKNATEAIGGDEIGVDAMEFSPGRVEGESGSGMYFPWNRQNRFAMAGAWSSQGCCIASLREGEAPAEPNSLLCVCIVRLGGSLALPRLAGSAGASPSQGWPALREPRPPEVGGSAVALPSEGARVMALQSPVSSSWFVSRWWRFLNFCRAVKKTIPRWKL